MQVIESVEKEISRLVDEVGYSEASRLFKTLKGGKRLRAKLILKIAPEQRDAPLLGAIVELIHAASLLHDDVIDDATLRRGAPSVNATEDSKTAIMLGDILYSKAFSSLVAFDSEVAKTVADAVTALSVGEMMDVRLAEDFNDDEEIYMRMLYLKTAALIEAAAKSAAQLRGMDAELYALYGRNLGLSFQIIDDILDIVSDEETLGKPALNDFVEGKCTLPYIHLFHSLDADEKERLKSYHKKRLCAEDAGWIKMKMKEHGSIEYAYAYAGKLSDEALGAVGSDEALRSIIETMMKRSY
jgi:octaprenyl-diphosphate synthase